VRTGRGTGRVPGWARAATRSSNRPPARVARHSGTFDRTRTCDDQRSWGEQAREYTPTDDVPPTAYAIPRANVYREDTPEPSIPQGEALANAPEQEDGRFKVPRIVESTR